MSFLQRLPGKARARFRGADRQRGPPTGTTYAVESSATRTEKGQLALTNCPSQLTEHPAYRPASLSIAMTAHACGPDRQEPLSGRWKRRRCARGHKRGSSLSGGAMALLARPTCEDPCWRSGR